MPTPSPNPATVGLLLSGGLDSCALLGYLLREGYCVQPFYVRCGLAWEREEHAAAEAFIAAIESPCVRPPITFEQPVGDLYGDHWSVTGQGAPRGDSPDDAVYLLGRNAILLLKPALWCGSHGIEHIALAVLGGNPFGDATETFFRNYSAAISIAIGRPMEILRPFADCDKASVVRRFAALPLELSLSCIAPVGRRHCGRCNKCAERRAAFREAGVVDRTPYSP